MKIDWILYGDSNEEENTRLKNKIVGSKDQWINGFSLRSVILRSTMLAYEKIHYLLIIIIFVQIYTKNII